VNEEEERDELVQRIAIVVDNHAEALKELQKHYNSHCEWLEQLHKRVDNLTKAIDALILGK